MFERTFNVPRLKLMRICAMHTYVHVHMYMRARICVCARARVR